MHTVVSGQRIRIVILIATILALTAPSISSLPVKRSDKNNARMFAYDPSVALLI